MALTWGWHIILARSGEALPAMILVTHWRGIRRDDQVALGLALPVEDIGGLVRHRCGR